MSEIALSRSPSNAPSSRRNSAMNRMLLWKEMRQLGVYSATLVAAGLATILLIELLVWRDPSSTVDLRHLQVGIIQLIPILVTLTSAAAVFSIEHEYKSFAFLRSMPFSPRRIVVLKILSAAGLSLLSAFLLWPTGWFIGVKVQSISTSHDWFLMMIETVSLFFLGIYSSMTSKKILMAVGKACVGFAVISLVPNITIWTAPETGDSLYWRLEYGFKLVSIVALVLLITIKSRTWCNDSFSPMAQWARPAFPRYEIRSCPPIRLTSPFWRLLWLQRRTGICFFVFALMPFCFFLKSLSADFVARSPSYAPTLFSRSALCLAFSVGILGSGIFNGIQSARTMLVQQNYRPSLIWLSQLIVPVFICLIAGLVIDSYASKFSRRIFYFTESMLIGLAAGQMFSLFIRSYIVAITLTFLALWNAFLLHDYLTDYVDQFWPSWVCLIGLPFVTTFILRRKWLYSQSMRSALVPFLWLAAAISVVQFPINRVVEIPWVSDHEVARTLPRGRNVNWEMLHDLQKIIDDRELTEYSYDLIEQVLDEYKGGDILLTHTRPNEKDLRRFSQVDAVLYEALTPKGGLSDRVYALKMKILETWPRSLRLFSPSFDGVIRLAQDRRTTTDDLRQLIEAFKYENYLERYRYRVAANYFSVERSSRYRPVRYPQPGRVPMQRSSFGEFFVWERSRESRARNFAAVSSIQYIDALSQSLERSEKQAESLERTRTSLPPLYRSIVEEYPDFDFAKSVPFFHATIKEQRILRIGLAIVAWQKDHNGEHPETLDQLVGVYLDHIPENPINETPFCYSPDGLPSQYIKPNGPTQNLIKNGRDKGGRFVEKLVSNQPFLWVNDTYWDAKPDDIKPTAVTLVEGLKRHDTICDPRLIQFFVIPRVVADEPE